jgi:hypothetical protein
MKIKELRKAVQEISKEMNTVKAEAPETEVPSTEVEPQVQTGEEPEASTDSKGTEFISMILDSATQAHIYHLQSDSYAQHMALCAYYTGMPATIDALAELLQGRYGILRGYKAPAPYLEDNNVVEYFKTLLDAVDTQRANLPQDSNIQNSVDTVVDLIQSTLYKLTFLK